MQDLHSLSRAAMLTVLKPVVAESLDEAAWMLANALSAAEWTKGRPAPPHWFPGDALAAYGGYGRIPSALKRNHRVAWGAVGRVLLLMPPANRQVCWHIAQGCHELLMVREEYRAYFASLQMRAARREGSMTY
jgi:hypothetical protein